MKIDLGSISFNANIENGGGTPSWGTALGQSSPDYKITYEGAQDLVVAMTHCYYDKKFVYIPLGKGGKVYCGADSDEIQQAAVFTKTFINGIKVNQPFALLLTKDSNSHHLGRKSIKYSNKIVVKDEQGDVLFSNDDFYKEAQKVLGISENASWFVYAITPKNQDELHFSGIVVNSEKEEQYIDSATRKNVWSQLVSQEESKGGVTSIEPTIVDETLQQIYYGAPGTGKSHIIKEQTRGKNVIRTTFHPDSDYSTFVGAYKPTTKEVILRDLSGHVVVENGQPVKEEKIVYEFVSQAFLQSYVNAWKAYADAQQGEVATEQYLVIEEINRGNCAQIFGDLFQLLDRNDNGFSDYPIKADNDMKKQLAKAFKGIDVPQRDSINALYDEDDIVSKVLDGEVLLLPNNLYIWATMNTSDQSLFPIDSAFKRRWDWKYMPINNAGMKWRIAVNGAEYDWWQFLTKVNEYIGSTTNSEDKKLGYFFCKPKNGKIDVETFVGKVIFYLWNDVFKDYGFDGTLFQAADGNTLTFDKFYGTDANSINEQNVAEFLKNLGVDAIELSNDYDADDSDADEKKSYSYPDYSRYTFNGSQPMGKGPLGTAIIAKFVTEHKDMTFAQLKAELTDELLRPEPNKGLLFDISSDDKRYSKDYEPTEYVSSDGVRFVASKRWNINNVSNIIGFARKQGWEINDAEPYQRNNQYLEK